MVEILIKSMFLFIKSCFKCDLFFSNLACWRLCHKKPNPLDLKLSLPQTIPQAKAIMGGLRRVPLSTYHKARVVGSVCIVYKQWRLTHAQCCDGTSCTNSYATVAFSVLKIRNCFQISNTRGYMS